MGILCHFALLYLNYSVPSDELLDQRVWWDNYLSFMSLIYIWILKVNWSLKFCMWMDGLLDISDMYICISLIREIFDLINGVNAVINSLMVCIFREDLMVSFETYHGRFLMVLRIWFYIDSIFPVNFCVPTKINLFTLNFMW